MKYLRGRPDLADEQRDQRARLGGVVRHETFTGHFRGGAPTFERSIEFSKRAGAAESCIG